MLIASKSLLEELRLDEVLYEDVGSDKYDQRRYKKQKLSELYAGTQSCRIRTQNEGFGCSFCAKGFTPHLQVFLRMLEDEPLAP